MDNDANIIECETQVHSKPNYTIANHIAVENEVKYTTFKCYGFNIYFRLYIDFILLSPVLYSYKQNGYKNINNNKLLHATRKYFSA